MALERVGHGARMTWSVAFEPLVSWPVAAALAGLAALLSLAGLGFGLRGGWLRAMAFAALVLALLNPVLLAEEREALKSVVALVVDRSQSQEIDGRRAQTDQALEQLRARFAGLDDVELRVVEAGGGTPDERTQTRLFAALGRALADVPPSRVGGAILLTDGQVHDIPRADDLGAPLHALVTGRAGERDRRIRFEQAPRFGIVGKPLDMSFRVLGAAGESGTVEVRVSVNGEPAASERAAIGVETPLRITVPNAGRSIVEISIPKEDGELTDMNNRAVAMVDGIRENLRVLLVSGEPHAGERTWRNLLKSDASVDVVHFTILRPPEKQDGTPINELSLIAFPTRELFVERIDDFDLIIFDRYQHRDVLPIIYYDYIAEYVEKGGALLIAAGPEYAGDQSIARTPLIAALPGLPTGEVVEQPFFPRLTETGKRHPVTRGLEGSGSEPPRWSRWFRTIGVERPDGEVVLKGPDDRPLLILDRKGEGRVGMLLSDQGWLWARGFEGGGPHVQLYRQMAHWLMKEPELEEERLTADGDGMTLRIERQTMRDDAGPARVITPSGKTLDVALQAAGPGRFAGEVQVPEIGLYQIGNGDLSTLAHVGPLNAPEFADVLSTIDPLRAVAEASGGEARRLSDGGTPRPVTVRAGAPASGRDWIGFRRTGDSVLKSVDRVPLFAGFAGLGVLLLAFASTWYREGR